MAVGLEDNPATLLIDPIAFLATCWPHVRIYDKQRDIIQSVCNNKLTFVPAGNMLGKDFIAGFIIVWYFLSHAPCRIVTTSAKADHLEVLWGEIRNFIQTSKYPIALEQGGQLRVLQQLITREDDEISYVKSMVASDQSVASMGGHHAEYTLFVADEASGVSDMYWDVVQGWLKKALIIGNTWPCQNFFKHAIKGKPGSKDKGGDIPSPSGDGYYRKIIRIKAEDSPNVRLGLVEVASNLKPSHRMIVPGVKTYREYLENRLLWDNIHQCVALDADFYEGAEVMLYPTEWLNRAERIAARLNSGRKAVTIGVDVAEGGDKSCWTAIDSLGVIEQVAMKTPDTSVIPKFTLGFANKHGVEDDRIVFDSGGGGRQHADLLRANGHEVRAVPFGESPSDPDSYKRFRVNHRNNADRRDEKEDRYVYKNRRAEMYGLLRLLLDSSYTPDGFGIPAEYSELRRQLAPIPLLYDEEGRLYLPPKHRKPDASANARHQTTMVEMLGCSPDEADSLVLAVFGLLALPAKKVLGSLV